MQLVSQNCCVVMRQVAREIARCNVTIIKSRNIFVATSVARSTICFCFSQWLRQRCKAFLKYCKVWQSFVQLVLGNVYFVEYIPIGSWPTISRQMATLAGFFTIFNHGVCQLTAWNCKTNCEIIAYSVTSLAICNVEIVYFGKARRGELKDSWHSVTAPLGSVFLGILPGSFLQRRLSGPKQLRGWDVCTRVDLRVSTWRPVRFYMALEPLKTAFMLHYETNCKRYLGFLTGTKLIVIKPVW